MHKKPRSPAEIETNIKETQTQRGSNEYTIVLKFPLNICTAELIKQKRTGEPKDASFEMTQAEEQKEERVGKACRN